MKKISTGRDGDEPLASRERGVVAIYVAIGAVLFFGVGAFAVDVARWYVEGARLQKTADLAALAGVVYLPRDTVGADREARRTIAANGWDESEEGVTFNVVPDPQQETRLLVTGSSVVENTLARLFDVDTTTITRSAIADFAAPAALGSPCNVFGNQTMEDPADPPVDSQGTVLAPDCQDRSSQYWVNIAGKETSKDYGDDYSAAWCMTATGVDTIDNCKGFGSNVVNNLRYLPPGESTPFPGYVLIVEAEQAGDLVLEGYDLPFIETGDYCEKMPEPDPGFGNDPRYEAGETDKPTTYCAGDVKLGRGSPNAVTTRISVLNPSGSPYRPLDGEPVDQCNAFEYPGWLRDDAASDWNANTPSGELLRQSFHRWTGLCGTEEPTVIPNVTEGARYAVVVEAPAGGGHNRFALRASMRNAAPDAVKIFAANQFSIYASAPKGKSFFNLIQLDSSTAGKTLKMDFYDIGDANGSIKVTPLQPTTAGNPALDPPAPTQGNRELAYDNCLFTVGSTTNGWLDGNGPEPRPLANCTFEAKRTAKENARLRTIYVEIPSNYRCDPETAPATDCWVVVRVESTEGQNDTTTWSAEVVGDPVRLVDSLP